MINPTLDIASTQVNTVVQDVRKLINGPLHTLKRWAPHSGLSEQAMEIIGEIDLMISKSEQMGKLLQAHVERARKSEMESIT